MAKLLYIQASPRRALSKSTHVAAEFLKSYWHAHQDDRIRTINVFHNSLPAFDGLAVQAKYAILHGKDHTVEERHVWNAVEKVIADFKDADKYLLSLPMWNFGIPYRLKQYIDVLVQPGYTFKVGENGYEGLVRGKPLLAIYSRGGAYPEDSPAEAVDLQKKYIELIFGFMGFENIQSIVVEPTLQGISEEVEKVIEASIEKARSMAEMF
ncbi:MAG: NAD(P)H-dependent oxidoreductase [Phycisphaerae bacterium]|nr:NAD(P)H-dependent oxidoreductase [Phycisphaerae bacterium]